ncbi:transcriptional adapter 2-alpha-like isoform X1 [Orbicella faveolata]|uniref:transcriptional adapter 2-alpha-like isoform X1 n=1 Tax=Orbicella faveolata TaxID=48498 RepID=UPI0009E35B56|nr:transcriptional adapter 2-alpha-like isoform X1 [Orbicella faveolata]
MAVLVEAESHLMSEDNNECLMCQGVVKEPFVRCRQCHPTVDICLECFSRGAEEKDHHSDHCYEIVSNNFPVLEKNWNAQEEIDLLDGISDSGFQNWKEVAKQVQSKTEEECEEHYMRCYIDEPCEALQIPELKPVVPACTPSPSSAGIPFKAMDDPPRPPMDSARSLEMSGYMPCRGDFDVEYDNYAEVDIKDIEFDSTDSDLLRELKIAAVEIFLSRLRQRFYRKHIVRKYGLINIRKLQTVERKQSKAERDLRDSLRPFARLHSPDQHEIFVQGLLMENFLKKEIVSLQEYRSAGICTRKGAEVYERLHRHRQEYKSRRKMLDDILVHIQDEKACQVWLHRQAQIDSGQSLAPLPLPSLGRKPAARLDISGTPGVEQLRPMERELCSSLRLLPHDYQSYKSTLIKEYEKQGSLRLAQARTLIRIDVNKTRKMYNFFVEQGWVKQPDG